MMRFAALSILLFLTACASHTAHGQMGHPQIVSEEAFIAEMIPHHQEAVDASRLVLTSSANPQVRSLAGRIIAAQEQEIAMMGGWQREWYPESSYEAEYRPMMGDLVHASDRDAAYITGMIAHHTAAIQMAEQAQGVRLRPEVRQLADEIIAVQQQEIGEMHAMLD